MSSQRFSRRARAAQEIAAERFLSAAPGSELPSAQSVSGPVLIGIGLTGPHDAEELEFFFEATDRDARPSVPESISGLPVTARVFTADQRSASGLNPSAGTQRPARPGCSIGPHCKDGPTGTLGALVARSGRQFVLSCNHVLADENVMPPGTEIMQATGYDGGRYPNDVIGKLADVVPLDKSGVNQVDCALAEIDPGSVSAQPICVTLSSSVPRDAVERDRVVFCGRSSGRREATVVNVSTRSPITFRHLDRVVFEGLLLLESVDGRALADEGDSGALVVHAESGQAVGLLVSAGFATARAVPIGAVLTRLGVSLCT